MVRATLHRKPRHCDSARARYVSPMRVLLLPATLLLASCGFRPLYEAAPVLKDSAQLGGIAVDTRHSDDADDRRMAFLLREALESRLPSPGVEARYRLRVTPAVRQRRLAVGPDDVASRYDYNVYARYELTDMQSGEVVLKDRIYAVSTYGSPRDPYGRIAEDLSAAQLAADEAADRIFADLSVHFADPE